jgi:hypothetical protein
MRRALATIVLSVLIAPLAATAQVPSVANLSQSAVSRGQSVEVTVSGKSLAKVESIGLAEGSARGLDVSIVPQTPPKDDQLKLRLTAAADAPPGERELRLVAPSGVSAPVRVSVEQLPAVAEVEPNNGYDQAQAVAAPSALMGAINGPGDADLFRFPAAKGQTLIVDVLASRIRSALDPTVILYDPAGKEVASNNDTFGADSFLAYDVPADGTYAIELRDLQYRGGANFNYRIELGALPYLAAVEPMAGQRGKLIDLTFRGYNLQDADKRRIDLTYARAGRIGLRAQSPLGLLSNELPFEVTDLAPTVEAESNDLPQTATPTPDGAADVTGIIGRPGDVDFYKLVVARKQSYSLEVLGRRLGSPLDALLTLHNAKGDPIDRNDDAVGGGADARLGRTLDPGQYYVSVRDLSYGGGPTYSYRLAVRPSAFETNAGADEAAVRFGPDATRLSRGGAAKLAVDVQRIGGFSGPITLSVEGLPPGVSTSPLVLDPGHNGLVALSAAPDAPLGTYPIRVRWSAVVAGQLAARDATPLRDGAPVSLAYLTVTEPSPLTVSPIAALPADRIQAAAGEVARLAGEVGSASKEAEARQAQWEKQIAPASPWVAPELVEMHSHLGPGVFTKKDDGSVLVSGKLRDKEVYTIVARSTLKSIAGIRLEVLPDPALPNKGPGLGETGNFVLNEIRLTAAPASDAAKANAAAANAVPLEKASATFSQQGFGVEGAIDDKASTGWAVSPRSGTRHAAIFHPVAPIAFDGGATLTFVLAQQFGKEHNIGRFRLTLSADPAATDDVTVPEAVREIARVPREQRTPQQAERIGDYFRSVDPPSAAARAKLDSFLSVVNPYAEIARLEPLLNTQTPALDAAQKQWEQSLAAGAGWTPLSLASADSAEGARLEKQPDGSLFVTGPSQPGDTYTLRAETKLKGITALQLEAIPDARLPANGPGRATDGNFCLTQFGATVAPKGKPGDAAPIPFASAKASFEEKDHGAALAVDDKPETGWSVAPQAGLPVEATFYAREPGGAAEGDKVLTITLAQRSAAPGQTLGRFRVSATTAADPNAVRRLPPNIAKLLAKPPDKRNDGERAELSAYFRSNTPALEPIRARLAELRLTAPELPLRVSRLSGGTIPLMIGRNGNLPGDVTVTLEGLNGAKVNPLVIPGGSTVGTLRFEGGDPGNRLVMLRAETKSGDNTIVQYSPPFTVRVAGP